MVQYDPAIIQELAEGLYARAASIERICMLIGGVVGTFSGGSAGLVTGAAGLAVVMTIAGLLVGVFLGLAVGRSRAFQLRVQAQTALCQKKIEENTRQR